MMLKKLLLSISCLFLFHLLPGDLVAQGPRFETQWTKPAKGKVLYHKFKDDASAVWLYFDNDSLYKYSLDDGRIMDVTRVPDSTLVTINSETGEHLFVKNPEFTYDYFPSQDMEYYIGSLLVSVENVGGRSTGPRIGPHYAVSILDNYLRYKPNISESQIPVGGNLDLNGDGYLVWTGIEPYLVDYGNDMYAWEAWSGRTLAFYEDFKLIKRTSFNISTSKTDFFGFNTISLHRNNGLIYSNKSIYDVKEDSIYFHSGRGLGYSHTFDAYLDWKYSTLVCKPPLEGKARFDIPFDTAGSIAYYFEQGDIGLFIGDSINKTKIITSDQFIFDIPALAVLGEKVVPKHKVPSYKVSKWTAGAMESSLSYPSFIFDSAGVYDLTLSHITQSSARRRSESITIIDTATTINQPNDVLAKKGIPIECITNSVHPDQVVTWRIGNKTLVGDTVNVQLDVLGEHDLEMVKKIGDYQMLRKIRIIVSDSTSTVLLQNAQYLGYREYEVVHDGNKSKTENIDIKRIFLQGGIFYLQTFKYIDLLVESKTPDDQEWNHYESYTDYYTSIFEDSTFKRKLLSGAMDDLKGGLIIKRVNPHESVFITSSDKVYKYKYKEKMYMHNNNRLFLDSVYNIFSYSSSDTTLLFHDTDADSKFRVFRVEPESEMRGSEEAKDILCEYDLINHNGMPPLTYTISNNPLVVFPTNDSKLSIITLDSLSYCIRNYNVYDDLSSEYGSLDSMDFRETELVTWHSTDNGKRFELRRKLDFTEDRTLLSEPFVYDITEHPVWAKRFQMRSNFIPLDENPDSVNIEIEILDIKHNVIHTYLPDGNYSINDTVKADNNGFFIVFGDSVYTRLETIYPLPDALVATEDNRTWQTLITSGISNSSPHPLTASYSDGILTFFGLDGARQSPHNAQVVVSDISGRLVFRGEMANGKVSLDLAQGQYLVRVGNSTAKLMVR